MNNRTASKWFAACVAALSLSMVTSVSAADAKPDDIHLGQARQRLEPPLTHPP